MRSIPFAIQSLTIQVKNKLKIKTSDKSIYSSKQKPNITYTQIVGKQFYLQTQ